MKLSYKYSTFIVPVCLLQHLKRRMRWVRAAGGIVTDDSGDMLLIRRNNRWDLPKGKVEPGETLLQAALREVEEETGISVDSGLVGSSQWIVGSTRGQMLPTKTYHIFNLYGGWHLKQTSWFAMHAVGSHPCGTAQQEEGITEVVWVSPQEWQKRLKKSYGTMRTLIRTQWTNSHR